ncbi:3690_t:CDS:2 [Ambispora gerdemannii]|uniref:3690_t:CDS:1 n=1 Tax=Ambispora gerdemannii TaxID=144530 RepID=A0A9N8UZ82_9GLOM|nr:3690_t:CDS:2 [Ambispora gerdemannii]
MVTVREARLRRGNWIIQYNLGMAMSISAHIKMPVAFDGLLNSVIKFFAAQYFGSKKYVE